MEFFWMELQESAELVHTKLVSSSRKYIVMSLLHVLSHSPSSPLLTRHLHVLSKLEALHGKVGL